MEKVLFYIDGNIGVGKSTVLSKLKENEQYKVIDEPLSKYCSFGIFNPLNMFYQKMISNFDFFNYLYYNVWFPLLDEFTKGKVPIVCRGVHTGAYIFGVDENENESTSFIASLKDLVAKQYISILKERYENIVVLYLHLNPEECYKRLRERDRAEESVVTLEYITKLHNLHEQLFNGKNKEIGFTVIKIDISNLSPEEVRTLVEETIEKTHSSL